MNTELRGQEANEALNRGETLVRCNAISGTGPEFKRINGYLCQYKGGSYWEVCSSNTLPESDDSTFYIIAPE